MLTILTTGDWPRGSLRVRTITSTRRIIPEVESLIDSAWHQGQARLGGRLFDGPMCRIESWQATPESLELTLSQTSYRVFLGTNLNPSVPDKFGRDVYANPVGVSCILLTLDGWLMYGRRNVNVAYYPNRVHPFAGTLEPDDLPDVFGSAERELREELNIGHPDIESIHCAGIAEDAAIRHPELVFRIRSTLARERVEHQLARDEHGGCVAIKAERDAIEPVLANPGELTPIAMATLLLFGREDFGVDWFQQERDRLLSLSR